MAEDRSDDSVLNWLQGLRNPEESQADFRPGDPQQAALAQFLSDQNLGEGQIVVDFGSGRGLLAQMLKHVYQGRPLPRYFAVDLPNELDQLSVPNPIHNNSRKITVEDFYQTELKLWSKSIAAVVIRNVLHELTITQTCFLFQALNAHLPEEAIIYIQDVADLPRAEERNVGWRCDILIDFLREIGFKAEMFGLASFSGTNWFALMAHPTGAAINEQALLRAAIGAREKQKREMLAELARLNARTDARHFIREVKLNHEIASLEFQLSECRQTEKPSPTRGDLGVPLIDRTTFGPLDFAVHPGVEAEATGMVAVLSHKRLVDFAALIRTCRQEALFSGYSQRSLFQQSDIRAALFEIIASRGCKVRIIVAAPDSAAAQLRASEPLYEDPSQLKRDIRFTMGEADGFGFLLTREKGAAFAADHFQLRTSLAIPYSSFFIIDDLCFVSLYSQMASGTAAPCFVYRRVDKFSNGYFDVLRNDFEARWTAATGVSTSTSGRDTK